MLAPESISFTAWWISYGRGLAIVLTGAAVAAAIAVGLARRCLRREPAERTARRLARDVVTLAVALALCLIGVVAGYFVMTIFRTRVRVFFFPAGVAFFATAVVVPAWLALDALRRRETARLVLPGAILALATSMLFLETNRLEVLRATIEVPTLPDGATVRIAHVSDLQTIGLGSRERSAAEAIDAFDPDLVVLTGDVLAGAPTDETLAQARGWIAGLRSRTSRFVVSGDSDPDFARVVGGLEGVKYLRNEGVALDVRGATLYVAGIENFDRPQKPEVALAKAPAGATRILLSHNPDAFVSGNGWHAELGLAGHTHGGQVHLPFVGALVTFTWLGPRYSDGVFTDLKPESNRQWNVDAMAVCAGLGMEGGFAPRVRFLRPPQVILLTLTGAHGRAPAK